MKTFFVKSKPIIALLVLILVLISCASNYKNSQFKKLVWSDEFNYTGLPDSTKWNYDIGGDGFGNNEAQFYTKDRLENARVENGNLVIEARKEDWENKNYTSARLVTKGKQDWKYARIEVRAKLPKGKGTWSAIWMLSTDMKEWPEDGELDIMEHVGYNQGIIHASVHTKKYNHILLVHKKQILLS